MRPNILTDAELRAHWFRTRETTFSAAPGVMLTPAARDFLKEHSITLVYEEAAGESMSVRPIPFRDGKPVFVDASTGAELPEKPEEMTHLRDNLLVPKTHPRIAFRGQLDALQADIIALQVLAENDCPSMGQDLEELLACCRELLKAEVTEQPMPQLRLLGMDSDQLRRCSHRPKEFLGIDHPIPSSRQGMLCAELNRLRTRVREAELSAARAFTKPEGGFARVDIIEGLNRLSSAVYIIFCRKLSGRYANR